MAQYGERRDGGVPAVVLVSPVHVDDTRPAFDELCRPQYGAGAAARSRQLAAELHRVADARGVLVADAASVAEVGDDGVHLSTDSHRRLAELLAGSVRGLAGSRCTGQAERL